ncbi:MAG: CHAT domain-containing protein, partial [Myxococcota bacterium]
MTRIDIELTADAALIAGRPARILRRHDRSHALVVLPPENEAAQVPDDAPHAALVKGQRDPTTTLMDLATDSASDTCAVALGRYLFDVLLGTDAWQDIRDRAAGQLIELGLRCDVPELANLPWEAMHDGSSFLAGQDNVRLARRIPADAPGPLHYPSPPRVLFVIGSELGDPRLRAGTEFLAVIRRVETEGTTLRTRLLLNASLDAIATEMAAFQPTIVHIIAHGSPAGGLTLRADDDRTRDRLVDAGNLLAVLQPPPIAVVISACFAGGG